MPPEAPDLDPLTVAGSVEQVREDSAERVEIVGDTEVWPVEVFVGPRWIPVLVEVEAEPGGLVAEVRIVAEKADTHDCGVVGETHRGAVNVSLRWWSAIGLPIPSYGGEFCERDVRNGAAAQANRGCNRDGMRGRRGPSQGRLVVGGELVARNDASRHPRNDAEDRAH